MGYFSWLTSDTKKSIPNSSSGKKTFTVHLITEDHQVFTESEYEGYGVFGGKDIYVLIGQLNGVKGFTENDIRNIVFNTLLLGGIRKGLKKYYYKKDFASYDTPIKAEGNKSANELVEEEGFQEIFPHFDFEEFEREGIVCPKIVRYLPKDHEKMSKKEWKKFFYSLPYPKSCPNQGYFYDEH